MSSIITPGRAPVAQPISLPEAVAHVLEYAVDTHKRVGAIERHLAGHANAAAIHAGVRAAVAFLLERAAGFDNYETAANAIRQAALDLTRLEPEALERYLAAPQPAEEPKT